ncbi:MAG: hypothetical protein WBC05_05595 [Sedimentisphaerales bacterium]
MSIGFTRRDMLQFIGAGAMSMAIPKRLHGAQKDGKSKQPAAKPLTFFGWSEVTVIRITSNRLVAIPYDYSKGQWIDNPGKILDVKISR